jgi:integrase/recombinase XerD
MKVLPNVLARALRGFFADHLPRVRGASPHTIESYRDSLALLLRFVASRSGRSVARLDVEALRPQEIIDFLHHLEADRQNSAATRNVRLAAVHAFFRYLATEHPDRLEHCQRVLAVPFKRARPRIVEYLEYEEIEAVLAAVDRTSRDGRRDYALLATMFNTGVRVQELLGLRACDIRFERPAQIRVLGKGRKERLCPLWPQTAEILQSQLLEDGVESPSTDPVFRNHRGEPLTRFGVRYILRKYCERARTKAPTLAHKRLHPHSMRHSTAVHLLRSGVDIVTISHWLGHASVTTTNRYATVDLEMKRKAIERARPTSLKWTPFSGPAA